MPHERRLSVSPFPDDSGQPAPTTREALRMASASSDPIAYLRAVAALCGDRLLVLVTASTTRAGRTEAGLVTDQEAEMAVVLLAGPAGRRALLAFSGMDALQTWDPTGRPVPVTLDVAAAAALDEGADALLVDVAGPYPLVLEEAVLGPLAGHCRLVELADGGFGWARDAP